MEPAIFISYPRQDSNVANKLRDALTSLSSEIDVLIDHAMIDPGDDYEEKISSGISRSKWFILICVGNFLIDRDMTWCYYEAGQFRQVLRAAGLNGEQIDKKICVLYDVDIPRTLARYNAVKVNGLNTGGVLTLPSDPISPLNSDLLLAIENSRLFDLFTKISRDSELEHPRDTGDATVRNLMRLGVASVVRSFASAQQDSRLEEIPIAPSISITFEPTIGLNDTTTVEGKQNSLAQIFGIAPSKTTWGALRRASLVEPGVFPLWLEDITAALNTIIADEVPAQSEMYCVARTGGVYRPIISRSERFLSGRKIVHVIFVPAQKRSLLATGSDGRLTSIGLLLGALVLVVRYQLNVVANYGILEKDDVDVVLVGRNLERALTKIEQEAEQLGYVISRDPDAVTSSPLLDAITDNDAKAELTTIVTQWRKLRMEIITLFRQTQEPVTTEEAPLDRTDAGAKEVVLSVFNFLRTYSGRSAVIVLEEMTKRFGQENTRA